MTRQGLQGRGPNAVAPSGLSAGSDPLKYSAWLDSSGSYLSNSDPTRGSQGRSWDVLTGVDTVIDDRWVVGLSAGYSAASLTVNGSQR